MIVKVTTGKDCPNYRLRDKVTALVKLRGEGGLYGYTEGDFVVQPSRLRAPGETPASG